MTRARRTPEQRYREKSREQAIYELGDARERIAVLERQLVDAYNLALSMIGSPIGPRESLQLLSAVECRDLQRKDRRGEIK